MVPLISRRQADKFPSGKKIEPTSAYLPHHHLMAMGFALIGKLARIPSFL